MPRESHEAFTSIARYLDSELQISDHTRECVERLKSGEEKVSLNHSLKVSCPWVEVPGEPVSFSDCPYS